jgi:hypothetical protein
MTSQEPSGAVDHDFDDAATDAEESLRKNIAAYPSAIEPGDIVIDLVEGRPLYVRERKGTAVDVFEREAFDLTTYKAHPWLPIGPHDDVFECVFLPTKPSKLPSKKKSQTYTYPRGRLARVAVEWLYDSDTHRHAEQTIDALAYLFENAADPDYRQATVDVAVDTFGTKWVDLALEVAGFDPSKYGADADDRSQRQDPVAVLAETGDATAVHEAIEAGDMELVEKEDDVLSETELKVHAIRNLVHGLEKRDVDDDVFEAIAEVVVHDFEPVVGDHVMPNMPKRPAEDDAEPQGSTSEDDDLGDFEDFDGGE